MLPRFILFRVRSRYRLHFPTTTPRLRPMSRPALVAPTGVLVGKELYIQPRLLRHTRLTIKVIRFRVFSTPYTLPTFTLHLLLCPTCSIPTILIRFIYCLCFPLLIQPSANSKMFFIVKSGNILLTILTHCDQTLIKGCLVCLFLQFFQVRFASRFHHLLPLLCLSDIVLLIEI